MCTASADTQPPGRRPSTAITDAAWPRIPDCDGCETIGYVLHPSLLYTEVNMLPRISIYNVPGSLHMKYMINLLTT